MIEITGLTTGYGRSLVLHDVTLQVNQGEIVALVGSNGAGKSTFLKTVSGVHRNSRAQGKIVFDGVEVTRASAPSLVGRGLSLVPERRQIWPDMSVHDHLRLGAFRKRGDRAYVATRTEFCLNLFPRLKERLKQHAGTLSGGEQQMLAMARALMAGPRLLLLDEPSTGLSPLFVTRILEIVEELRASAGMTILLVEQMVTQTLQISDRAYVLDRGRIVLSGDAKALLDDPAVKASYLGDQGLETAH
ncbi:MAG: ABC transporter ATP-binding protein [Janthinobacterium lividum]